MEQTFLTKKGYVDIKSLKVGDSVIGRNGKENKISEIREFNQEWFEEQGIIDQYRWYLINKQPFFATQNIYVTKGDYNLCHIFELQVGWVVLDENGKEVVIESMEKLDIADSWYKLTLDGDHSYAGNGLLLHNASRFWVGAGSTTLWNATVNTNWSATSGGANNASVPGASDDITFDGAGGGNSASTTANITVLSMTFTAGYTNTITKTGSWTVAGNVTLHANATWTGAGTMTISATSTIVWGGVTWNSGLLFSGSNTKTFSGNGACSGLFTASTSTTTINVTVAETFTLSGGITTTGTTVGTVKIILTGGTWQGTNFLSNNVDIQGNVTFVSGTTNYSNGILTYVSGTPVVTGNTFNLGGTTAQLNVASITFNNVSANNVNTVTVTLLANLNMSGNFTAGTNTTATHTWNGLFNINVGGNWTMNSLTTGIIAGTSTVVMTGASPTLSMTAVTSGSIKMNMTLAHSGTATITGGAVSGNNGGYRYISPAGADITMTVSSGLITISDALTFSGAAGQQTILKINATGVTIASWRFFAGTSTLNYILNGSQDATIGTITAIYNTTSVAASAPNVIFANGRTYTISTALNTDIVTDVGGQLDSRFVFKSDSAGNQAIIKLAAAATQNLYHVDFTDIDASPAQTIFSFAPVLSNVKNIISTPTAPMSMGFGNA